jgi:predicted CxxxxCH...CXXCH cytochrome family protein
MILAPLALAALFACSGGNSAAPPALDSTGNHAANWVQQHWITYRQANGGSGEVSSTTACSECHGSDLAGGVSKVGCFRDSLNGMSCHNNDDHTLGHPAAWIDPSGGTGFHANASYNGALVRGNAGLASSASCGLCHATDSNILLVGSAPSCLTPGSTLGVACHSTSPALNPSGCVSCHSVPPSSASASAAPNRAGAHVVHLSLVGVSCGTCHFNYGSGTEKHASAAANGAIGTAFLSLSSPYRAKSGSFSYMASQCSAVSCHGGKPTPDWYAGSIEVASDCLACHEQGLVAQSPQYNSFYSGNSQGTNLHQFHLDPDRVNPVTLGHIFCTDCHNPDKLSDPSQPATAQHFGALSTPGFERAPSATIGGGSTLINSYGTINNVNFSCDTRCHLPLHWR